MHVKYVQFSRNFYKTIRVINSKFQHYCEVTVKLKIVGLRLLVCSDSFLIRVYSVCALSLNYTS